MPRPGGRLAGIGLALASLAATLLLLEVAFRLARRSHGGGKEAGTIGLYTEHDEVLGWRKRPGARATFRRAEYTVEVAINSRGLRDVERPYQRPADAFRILALGDSFVEGYSVPLEQALTRLLESSLAGRGCRLEVINGATAAYSTDQEYLFYSSEGARYSPQVVVLFFYYNDVLFNARSSYYGSPKPLFEIVDEKLVLSNTPIPAPRAAAAPAAPAPARPPVEEPSALFAWVRERMRRGAPRAYDTLARTGLWPAIEKREPQLQLKVYKRRELPELQEAWERTHYILEAMAREVEAAGSRFLVAYVPNRMEVNDRDWDLTKLELGADEQTWDRRKVALELQRIGRESRFPVLDLTPGLRAAERGILGGPYFVLDGHWNATGHRVVARELESWLEKNAWLPPCGT